MLADLLVMMSDTVQHWRDCSRDLFGKTNDDRSYTEHRARVVFTPGVEVGTASRQQMASAAATVWLINHPRPVRIGDTFTLIPSGDVLKAIRIETRQLSPSTLTKVFLS